MKRLLLYSAALLFLFGCSAPEEDPHQDYVDRVIAREMSNKPAWAEDSEQPGARNVLIKCKRVAVDNYNMQSFEIAGRTGRGRHRSKLGTIRIGQDGISATILSDDLRLQLGLNHRQQRNIQTTAQYVTVMDGATGFIHSGTTTFTSHTYAVTRHGHYRTPVRQDLGESLMVCPRILKGGVVEIALKKASAQPASPSRHNAVDHSATMTIVRMRSGDTIVISGLASGSAGHSSYIINGRRVRQQKNYVLLLTVKIL